MLPKSAIARIYSEAGTVVGAGCLVRERMLISCAHLITLHERTETPAEIGSVILLDFPLVAPGNMLRARIDIWRPDLDIVGMTLETVPPFAEQPIELVADDDVWGHQFRAFGFPEGNDAGVWASGRLLGRQASGWLQIEDVKNTGYFVSQGFSGGPVWDEETNGVVGITVASVLPSAVRAGFVIPSSQLVAAWPELGKVLRSSGDLEPIRIYLASTFGTLSKYRRLVYQQLTQKRYAVSPGRAPSTTVS